MRAEAWSWWKKGKSSLFQQAPVKALRMLFWAEAGMTVSGFVCRNFPVHVREAAGMFAALSWTRAQTGGFFCWLPPCDSCMTGPPQLGFTVCVHTIMHTYVWVKAAAVASVNVICACSIQAPSLVSYRHWPADGCFCFFAGAERAERSGAGAGGIHGDDWLLSL